MVETVRMHNIPKTVTPTGDHPGKPWSKASHYPQVKNLSYLAFPFSPVDDGLGHASPRFASKLTLPMP
nr:hypothetical protein [Tanacetum cinerariifolium]